MRWYLLLFLASCGSVAGSSERTEMLELARSGAYRTWPSEAAPHGSAGPHGTVRTFVNPALFDSLRMGAASHPNGSIALKELYAGDKVTGYAIDWKGDDGQWRFFEGFEPAFDQYFYTGTENGCAGCHRPGSDFVLTPVSALEVR